MARRYEDASIEDLFKALEQEPDTKQAKKQNIHRDVLQFIKRFEIRYKKQNDVWCYILYELYTRYIRNLNKNSPKKRKIISEKHFFMEFNKIFKSKKKGIGTCYNVDFKDLYDIDVYEIIEKWEDILMERRHGKNKKGDEG